MARVRAYLHFLYCLRLRPGSPSMNISVYHVALYNIAMWVSRISMEEPEDKKVTCIHKCLCNEDNDDLFSPITDESWLALFQAK